MKKKKIWAPKLNFPKSGQRHYSVSLLLWFSLHPVLSFQALSSKTVTFSTKLNFPQTRYRWKALDKRNPLTAIFLTVGDGLVRDTAVILPSPARKICSLFSEDLLLHAQQSTFFFTAKMSGGGNTVCVTGASGYLASYLIKLLLERGYTVRASVRDQSK